METKQDFRREINRRRKLLEADEAERWSRIITEYVTDLDEYRNASVIYLYIDYKNEVQTRFLMEAALRDGKTVAAPKVNGKDMIFYRILSDDDLENGYMGIREPKTDLPVVEEQNGLMVTPGVAFDRELHRVGYGGGFYDRFLETHPGITRVAVAYTFQVFDAVPHEAFDICPHILVTEQGIIRSKENGTDHL